jgi:hypothetical protein
MTHHHPAAVSRRLATRAVRGLAVILVVASPLWRAAPVDAASEPTSYYLSVGNSLAQGFQPIGGPHTNSAAAGYNQGYADQLFKLASDGGGEHLRLVKLGCGGESTATMITDSRCQYGTGSQLGDAVEFLDQHPGEIAFITIDIGANDIFLDCEGDPACFIPQISTNLPHILNTLREHAGPGVPIVGMKLLRPRRGAVVRRPSGRPGGRRERRRVQRLPVVAVCWGRHAGGRRRVGFRRHRLHDAGRVEGRRSRSPQRLQRLHPHLDLYGSAAGPRRARQQRRLRRHRRGLRGGARRLTAGARPPSVAGSAAV